MADNEKLGSTSPQILLKNATNLDKLVNGRESESLPDRFAVLRRTWYGMEMIFNRFITYITGRGEQAVGSIGWQELGNWATGLTVDNRQQIVYYNGSWYKYLGELEHVITGDSPENDGGVWSAENPTGKWSNIGDAALRSNLGSSEPGNGGSIIALEQGGTVQDAINYVTPLAYKTLVVSGDWSAALVAADLKARDLGWVLDGQGLEYAIGSAITLRCSRFRNMSLVPTPSYEGAAPIFVSHLITGLVEHDSVEVIGFKLTGAKILQGTYVGTTEAIFKGICRYNYNGNLIRTTLTADVNTATAWVIPVADASSFAAEDAVHIGDGRYKILSVSGNNITLYNDGVGATLFDSGTRYQHYTGQYVTKNQGYDNNGIRIGNHTQGWNIKVAGLVEAIGNGWSGFYHDSGAYGGYHEIDGVRASSNGYIGIGLGYVNKGYVRNCIAEFNGNNGIDIFEAKQTYAVENNLSVGNGVDNIFVGGNGEVATVSNNNCLNAFRIGVLVFGRTAAIYGAELSGNKCLGNKYRSIGFTGVRYGKIIGGNVGGAANWSIFIEGRAGLNNPDKIVIKNVDMYQSTLGDVGGNLMNNTGYASGTVDLIDNNTFSRMPAVTITNVNYYGCKFYPECYIAGTGEYSAAAGVNIAVSLSVRRPHNSTVTDAASARQITFSISSQPDGSDQSTVTSAVKSLANAVEILNNATTRGKIVVIPDLGVISYNFRLDTAGTRYILVECGGFRKVLTLTWT
ncbi:right-handed parallel beta-helix repeat-containing protein [Klebsiella michiganensis]|uniref:right-handed parallel beta-helix repeat-containing protein n=2 Tax=Klebsiella michiganensis TaxID=1134687 RepID=UPI003DA080EC